MLVDGQVSSSRPLTTAVLAVVATLAVLVALVGPAVAQPMRPGAGAADRANAGPAAPAQGEPRSMDVEVVSGRPDTITDGSALVRVRVPHGASPHELRVEVEQAGDRRDVTDGFVAEPGERSYLGVVDGMEVGAATIEAAMVNPRARGRSTSGPSATLEVRNFPAQGPVFSGPHQQPFFCDPTESGLSGDYDEFCHVEEPVVEYFYRPVEVTGDDVGDGFVPLPDPTSVPDDAQTTTTTEGVEVPFIVRNERGTLNRGIYNIAVLYDPEQPDWGDPTAPQSQWNERLYYQLEGACRPGYTQDRERAQDVLRRGQVDVLGAGFAVARHTFSRHGNACGNDVLTAESMMMTREHFTVHYGEPRHMIGNGGSGGAILQYLTADNYPGILDGIIATATFPDAYSIASGAGDAELLNRYFMASDDWDYDISYPMAFATGQWSPQLESEVERLRAVSGFGSWAINLTWVFGNTRNVDPTTYIGRFVPESELYHPETNPGGIRATIYEAGRNVWGTDPDTGFARRPLDNVGVQYGLHALEAGTITPEEFVALNERIGGIDIDAQPTPERMDADPEVVALAYDTGRVLNGGMGLAEVPTLNLGLFQDTVELGADYHDRFRDFSVRARMLRENGHVDNHVMWHADPRAVPADFDDLARLLVMDEWVTAIGKDDRRVSQEQKVRDNRPADLTDRCITADGSEYTALQWPVDLEDDPCLQALPPSGDPRIAAGGPIANDVIKCTLAPLERDAYEVTFTDDQWERLQAAFPGGVCDYSQPGVAQRAPIDTWLSFDTPGVPVPLSERQ